MTCVPNIANWRVFAPKRIFMLAMVAAADGAKVQKKSTAFLYIAKRNHTLCTLYINRCVHCVFYSIFSVCEQPFNKANCKINTVICEWSQCLCHYPMILFIGEYASYMISSIVYRLSVQWITAANCKASRIYFTQVDRRP